jgi:hypothetical protein
LAKRSFYGWHRLALCLVIVWWTGLASVWADEPLAWERLFDGAELALWTPGPSCRGEVPPVYIVRADPNLVRFSVHHYRHAQLADPPTIQGWHSLTSASVLFNAGLFRENYAYLGLLFKDGRSLGSKRHPQWFGLFVAEPEALGRKRAEILDLTVDAFDETSPAYREAAQSLMLLDRTGKVRVRRSGKRAYQTLVAEEATGHLLIMKSAEPVSLWSVGDCLRAAFPSVRQAMAMDGGSSSDMLIGQASSAGGEPGGSHKVREQLLGGGSGEHIPLPAVIGLFPRK